MDYIIQVKSLRYAKICGERRLFHDVWTAVMEKWKPKTTRVTMRSSSYLLSSHKQPTKISLERSCSKVSQNSVEDKQGGLILVAVHRPSYLQKLNFAGCCPCNFEVSTSRNIFNWWLYFPCFIYYHFPNSYRIITSVQLLLLRHIFCVISVANKI